MDLDYKKLFICDNLGYSLPFYEVDNNSICYILEDDGSISKKTCNNRFQLKLLDSIKFNQNEMVNKLLKFIIEDYLFRCKFKVVQKHNLHLLPTIASNIVCNPSLSKCNFKNTYYIEDLDEKILMILPEPEDFGYLCYKTIEDIEQYGLFAIQNKIEVFIIEQ
jgi:hypothetical protein